MMELLSKAQVSQIHEGSLRILREIGINIHHREAQQMLAKAGARVVGARVYLSANQVEGALARIPHGFDLYGRSMKGRVAYRRGYTHFRPSGGLPFILDFQTGARREATLADAADLVRLTDALGGFQIVNAVISPVDAPAGLPNVHRFLASIRFSEKPNDITVMTAREVRTIAQICTAVRGSEEASREKPLTAVYVSPVSPLNWLEDQTEALFEVARQGLPLCILPCPMIGITAPITMAGAITMANAETLAGIALASLVEPRLPIVYCNRNSVGDMRTAVSTWGGPEIGLTSVMANQVAGLYGLPCNGYGLATAAKTYDAQCGYEKGINGLLMALGGGTVLSGGGALDEALTTSYEQLVIDSEINAMLLRCLSEITVDEDTLGLEALDAVVNGSTFMAEPHTVKHLRAGALWMPELGDRLDYETWAMQGSRAIGERAHARAARILAEHQVAPLDVGLEEQIAHILADAEREFVS